MVMEIAISCTKMYDNIKTVCYPRDALKLHTGAARSLYLMSGPGMWLTLGSLSYGHRLREKVAAFQRQSPAVGLHQD